jgi:tRNA G18 (ribose-2'-O)-methylase SpoU
MHDGWLRIRGMKELFIGLRTRDILSLNMIKTKRKLNNKRKKEITKINQICNYHNFSAVVRMCDRSHCEVRSIALDGRSSAPLENRTETEKTRDKKN